jgi:DNA-binding transcriptional ArsR family regulator
MDPDTLAALAEPTRFKIVELLRERPRSVNDIALLLGLSQPQASKHLHRLSQAGVVQVQPVAQQRIYALNQESFVRLEDWVSSFNHYWNQRFNDLEKHLKKGQ